MQVPHGSNPTRFFLSISSELSSKGYEETILFSRYIRQLKYDFGNFYFKMNYLLKESKVKSFIQEPGEYLLQQKPVSRYFLVGLLLWGFTWLACPYWLITVCLTLVLYPGTGNERVSIAAVRRRFRAGSYRVWTA